MRIPDFGSGLSKLFLPLGSALVVSELWGDRSSQYPRSKVGAGDRVVPAWSDLLESTLFLRWIFGGRPSSVLI
jgi:hypothetical protein